MAKRTFRERVERRRAKQAERDHRYRNEETIEELVSEVDRLCEAMKQIAFDGRATRELAQQSDDRSNANADRLTALTDVVTDAKTDVAALKAAQDGSLITIRQSDYDDLVATEDADSDADGIVTVRVEVDGGEDYAACIAQDELDAVLEARREHGDA